MRRFLAVALIAVLTSTCAPVRAASRQSRLDVQLSGPYVPRITFSEDVTTTSVNAAIELLQQAVDGGASAVVIEFNTPGGSVLDGFRLTKAIEASPVPVLCVVDGMAASMGFYLLQSCTGRFMTKRSFLMAHEPSVGAERGNAVDFENSAAQLRALTRAMIEHCIKKMSVTAEQFDARIHNGAEWWMDWREAVSTHAVDAAVETVQEVQEGAVKASTR